MTDIGQAAPRMMMKRDYAKHRGCSAPYISKLIRQGRLTPPALDIDSGMINVAEADRMLGDAVEADEPAAQTPRPSRSGNLTEARTRDIEAKAELAEMEVARRRGELLRRDAVATAAQSLFERVVAEVLGVPAAVSLDLASLTDPAAIEDNLTAALKRALAGMHEEFLQDAQRRSAA